MLNLKELKKNKEILKKIRFDLTPQNATMNGFQIRSPEDWKRLEELAEERTGYYFYVDVWDCQARLLLVKNEKFSSSAVAQIKEIPYELLIEAVNEVWAINRSGAYPINSKIEKWLRKELKI